MSGEMIWLAGVDSQDVGISTPAGISFPQKTAPEDGTTRGTGPGFP